MLICTHLGTIKTFRYMLYIFSCCYNSSTIQYIKFKFKALLNYTKTIKCVKFQGVWCTGVRVGNFRISPIVKLSLSTGNLSSTTPLYKTSIRTPSLTPRPSAFPGIPSINLCLVSDTGDIGKQCRPKSDATEYGVWSGYTLFAYDNWIWHPLND